MKCMMSAFVFYHSQYFPEKGKITEHSGGFLNRIRVYCAVLAELMHILSLMIFSIRIPGRPISLFYLLSLFAYSIREKVGKACG